MKKLLKTFLICSSIFVVLVVPLLIMFTLAGAFLVRKDPIKSSDALAILSGGGGERLEYGAGLYHEGIARRLILTLTDETTEDGNTSMANRNLETLSSTYNIPKTRILITRKTSTNTFEEAQAILVLSDKKGWESIVVVTDSFHSRRTGMIFDKIFEGSGIRVSIQPVDVPGYWYRPMSWWWTSESRNATISEYGKIIFFLSGQYEE